MSQENKAQAYGESVFDIIYLLLVLSMGVWYLLHGNIGNHLLLYGSMALVLGVGDAFHLVPRILSSISKGSYNWNPYLGVGKMITSITMTIFYLLLFQFWQLYYGVKVDMMFAVLVYLLSFLRIILCLMPQNHWKQNKESAKWAVYRNIPFIILGILIILLYAYTAYTYQDNFMWMPVAITLSFLFYIPVTLYATKNPKLGMLMLPKTVMYLWIVFMGLGL